MRDCSRKLQSLPASSYCRSVDKSAPPSINNTMRANFISTNLQHSAFGMRFVLPRLSVNLNATIIPEAIN